MTINKKSLVCTLLYLLNSVIEYAYMAQIDDYSFALYISSCLIIWNICFQMIIWRFMGGHLVSPFMVFMYSSYLFHSGQIIMTAIFPNEHFSYINYITVYMPNSNSVMKTLEIVVTCLNMIFLGGVMGTGIKSKKNFSIKKAYSSINISRQGLLYVSKILMTIAIPFRLFIDIQSIVAAIFGGYYGAISVKYSGIIDAIASFFYSAVILYYIGQENKKKRTHFLFVIVCYILCVMLTGNRGHQIVCLLMLFVVISLENYRYNIKKIVFNIVLMYLALCFIDVIYTMRELGIGYFLENLIEVLGQSLKTNIFFETIGSFGETIFTPYLVVEGLDNGTIDPKFGECFYKSLVSILPSIGETMRRLNIEANFAKMLNSWSAIGGSIVGEMYYNFRELYWIFSILIGILLSKISFKITNGIRENTYAVLLYSIPIFTNLLWWSRDSIGNAVRKIVWVCVCIWIIEKTMRRNNLYEKLD